MQLIGSRAQQVRDSYYDYSGIIATGGTAQLLLPARKSCSHLLIANNSAGLLTVQIGMPRFIATMSGGGVASIAVADPGMGFWYPPEVIIGGGGTAGDPQTFAATMPDWPSVNRPCVARAVMTGAAGSMTIASIEIDDPGAGYLVAPYVFVRAERRDATGCGVASATEGIPIQGSGGSYYINGTSCPVDAITIWGASDGQGYTCKWMP